MILQDICQSQREETMIKVIYTWYTASENTFFCGDLGRCKEAG